MCYFMCSIPVFMTDFMKKVVKSFEFPKNMTVAKTDVQHTEKNHKTLLTLNLTRNSQK
ncbi:hypothetical protein VCRA2123E131_40245 [Vibrio crassostreae]|nr:hypothetical protein VCRA2126E132_40093 [Vibrio crassostreae]CAK3906656.1 hypothetical protein VCRA2123E131_40245 [Vibrio crassostreae]